MKLMIIFLCMTFLVSCTSEPLSVRHYLLHTPENTMINTSDNAKPIVALQLLDVADYLRQPSLVMQVGQFELHYSHQDLWAEKLQSSYFKALLQDLNSSGQRSYVAASSPEAIKAITTIKVKLEHFHATDASTVVSSGHYWLSAKQLTKDKTKDLTSASHSFYFESELKQDGYAYAVKQLRALVANLAKQIEKDIAPLPSD